MGHVWGVLLDYILWNFMSIILRAYVAPVLRTILLVSLHLSGPCEDTLLTIRSRNGKKNHFMSNLLSYRPSLVDYSSYPTILHTFLELF